MRGQHYRARDKTVRKMDRDGLTEENLRSGETVRVSRREADCQALPAAADDSMNFQERRSRRAEGRKAGGKRRNGFSPDFKRPDCGEDDGAQAGLYQTGGEKAEFYAEDTVPAEAYGENVQGTCPDTEKIPETDSGIREVSSRQVPAEHSYSHSGKRKNYIPEPLAARYRRDGKSAVQGENFYREVESSDRMQGNYSDTGTDAAADSTPAFGNADMGTAEDLQAKPSYMDNSREKPLMGGEASGTGAAPDQGESHNRKKKQVYAYSQREKEQKKTQEGKENTAHREEARHTGNRLSAGEALQVSQKDAEKKNGHGRLCQERKEKASRLSFGEEKGMARGAGMRLAGRAAWMLFGELSAPRFFTLNAPVFRMVWINIQNS